LTVHLPKDDIVDTSPRFLESVMCKRKNRFRGAMVKIVACVALSVAINLPGASPSAAAADDLARGLTAYKTGNYSQALKLLRRAAKDGSSDAQFHLGAMYFNGHGVAQDRDKATRAFHDAAVRGNREAQVILGMMYWDGRGVPKDSVSAYMWFDIASRNGSQQAAESGNRIAASLSAPDIAEAQRRARSCLESDYQRCE